MIKLTPFVLEVDFSILRYLALAFIGFANAIPLPLMGKSTLSIWLSENGTSKDVIGLFALLAIPFSLKIFWTPLVDHFKTRKGALCFALFGISATLGGMSFIDPKFNLTLLAFAILLLSLFTGCLYVAGISYEIESLNEDSYGIGSAWVTTGYRIGLLAAGAGTLYLSELWNWADAFKSLALIIAFGSLFILFLPEPPKSQGVIEGKRKQFSNNSSLVNWFWQEIIRKPVSVFFQRNDWQLILLCILLFKFGDELAKSMEGPYYLSLGFSKANIAFASKTWGMAATILGGFISGFFIRGKDPLLSVLQFGFLHACSLFLYLILGQVPSVIALCCVVTIENFTVGMAMTAFIALLWRVCDKQYAAIQYALFWSLFSFKSDLVSCLGGLLAKEQTWNAFFSIVALVGVTTALLPIIFRLNIKDANEALNNK